MPKIPRIDPNLLPEPGHPDQTSWLGYRVASIREAAHKFELGPRDWLALGEILGYAASLEAFVADIANILGLESQPDRHELGRIKNAIEELKHRLEGLEK